MKVSVSADPAGLRASPSDVLFAAEVPSAREKDLFYRVALFADGIWTCTCPGYRYEARADKRCRHIDLVREARELSLTLAGILG
jgi:hypothetical protein